jgi:hypothetical protein
MSKGRSMRFRRHTVLLRSALALFMNSVSISFFFLFLLSSAPSAWS